MSEVNPGSVSLEENELPPPTVETPAPAVDAPQGTVPAPDDDPEGTIEGSGGVKFVPLGAVVETRGKLKERTAELETAKAELLALKTKADKLDQIQQEWNTVQPLIERVKNGTYQPPSPVEQPKGPLTAQEAIEYAKDLDLYKADGTPDVDRAQRLAAKHEGIAERRAQAAVAPYQQQSAQQQSNSNFEAAANFKDKSGAQVDRAILQQVWSTVPPEQSADARVAGILYRVAMAESMMAGKYKGAPTQPAPVVQTESLGGGQSGKTDLSAFERNFISSANMKPKDYETISGRYKPGERNELE